jgi:hypothetical protein
MNKPTDPNKNGDVVPVEAPQVPASKKPPNKFRLYSRLEDDAEEILEESKRLDDLRKQLTRRLLGEAGPEVWEAELDEWFTRMIARCREALKVLDPPENYDEPDDDDDDDTPLLKKKIISKRLAMMLAAVAVGEAKMPEGFEHMLLEHVHDAGVSYLAIEGGCRQIERARTFTPSIAVVLEAIKEHDKLWQDRRRAIATIEDKSAKLIERIEDQASTRYGEARSRWSSQLDYLQRITKQAIDAQNAARQAHLKVVETMALVATHEQYLNNAAVALREATDALGAIKEQQATRAIADDARAPT